MPGTVFSVELEHTSLSVRASGTRGLPLVMLHGSGFSKEVFAHQFDSPLLAGFRLIAIDLPGHGASSNSARPREDYSLGGCADAVRAVLARLDVARAVVFGWSLGGNVAIELMRSSPLVAGLVLTGTAPATRGLLGTLRAVQLSRDALLASKGRLNPIQARRFLKMSVGDHGTDALLTDLRRVDEAFRPIFSRSLLYGPGADQRHWVETAQVPIAMVHGSDDPIVRKSYLATLRYRGLWGGMCHFIPDTGHAPFFERPDLFDPMLAEFATAVGAEENAAARPAGRRHA